LRFDPAEHPVALQLGGCVPEDLARCAAIGEAWGYDEINLNVGCPSDRVQNARFGACLMAEPELVAASVRAMRAAVGIPVTVKTRIGIDQRDDYGFLQHFVEAVAGAGCRTVIVHARKAWLSGLSPKENREIPPLRCDYVYRLKGDFPHLKIVINGGITTLQEIDLHLKIVDGVMLGRAAYHNPWLLADPGQARAEVVHRMTAYCQRQRDPSFSLRNVTRHMLGLYHGHRRARLWRRMLSNPVLRDKNDPAVLLDALEAVESRAMMAA
jgi:tRNA-dihydrouridine synthase A